MTTEVTRTQPPVFSLPQDRLLTLNVNEVPVLRDAAGPGVSFQPLYLDPEVGLWTVMGIFAPGAELPAHLHTGAVHGYTFSGSWIYKEYPDQVQVAGSYLYEPASSYHTFHVPETNTEDTVVLFIVYGANVGFTEDGKFHSILDALTVRKLAEQWAENNGGGAVSYLKGGSAGYATDA
ncbi:MAG TPA: 2,4'-dihydroxyacetophenone dioxygenase family protein [Sphingobium sp.]|uniref:2,4'-dihydroxyacetophenone dioxygenase family protein n=1 Tax=Sphingobium sp. TaxID=1912891 RepID=UPI002ED3F362